MKIRFFSGIHEDKSTTDTAFRVRVIDLNVMKPTKASLIAEDGFLYLLLDCENKSFISEYKFSEYETAAFIFVQVSNYIEKQKCASPPPNNEEELVTIFHQP